ncbi:hypothetical protein N658DRAFT_152162 [Parathielavia hyrcaniae]|uniref:Uncharacterized protein n=1 Tax=Parathielavia hyrcaniae TaxID=113614 RepID=A0AAN6Q119_9PEZI|nr:hypothetical protein N658DRAFT_152162 [Parathielavia hyrcaniae]
MEALQSLRPATTSRRLHDFRHSREHLERESQIKNRTRSLQTSAHLDKITRAPLAALGRGPTPRPKEQNDEFIQSWLQQTQARDSHLLKIDGQRRQLQVAEQSGASDHIRKHQKRPRPVSDPSPPSPKAAERVEHRFEKRARHKTRDDKYDYKPRADKKRVSDQAHRGHTATGDGKERALRTERQHLTHQRDAGIATSHMIPRASKLIPKTNRPSRHRSITRRTSEPNASRSKLSKSQKEDKELEEFSAFFSRKTTIISPFKPPRGTVFTTQFATIVPKHQRRRRSRTPPVL